MPSTFIKKALQYFVALYGHEGFVSLDKLREHIFVATKSDLKVLPPTEDSLSAHFTSLLCIKGQQSVILSFLHLQILTESCPVTNYYDGEGGKARPFKKH